MISAPPPTEPPANVVAIVARVPDRRGEPGGVVTTKEFGRALIQVAAVRGRRAPEPGGAGYRRLKNEAMGALIDGEWIKGQAAEMGIGVRPREVVRVLAEVKREAFKSEAQYRRFLRESHYTRRDVEERLEIQILAEKIEERVGAGIAGEEALQKAFSKFVAEYGDRWRSRTVCAPGYVSGRCSNGPEPTRAT